MRLNDIKDNPGSRTVRKRVGRGIGSGLGKTGGRGGKGQTARTGVRIDGFEGGQMPLYRRLPKRGFNLPFPRHYNEISLGALQNAIDAKRIDPATTVTVATLVEAGILNKTMDGVRILGDGELKTKLNFEVNHLTKKATEVVEKLGGTIKLLKPKVFLAATGKEPKERPPKGKGKAKAAKD
jgi:large subunit ribosomal protein L15